MDSSSSFMSYPSLERANLHLLNTQWPFLGRQSSDYPSTMWMFFMPEWYHLSLRSKHCVSGDRQWLKITLCQEKEEITSLQSSQVETDKQQRVCDEGPMLSCHKRECSLLKTSRIFSGSDHLPKRCKTSTGHFCVELFFGIKSQRASLWQSRGDTQYKTCR